MTDIAFRFGHIYCFQLWPLAVAQKATEARKLTDRSLTLIAKAVGIDSLLHLQTQFVVAMTLFTTGFVDEGPKLHKEVFEKHFKFDPPRRGSPSDLEKPVQLGSVLSKYG